MAGIRTIFASAFLFANFAVFLWPLVVLFSLAFDKTMIFWFGNYLLAIFVVPVLFLSIYGWHMRAGRPVNTAMSVSFLFPCLLFFGMGIALYLQSSNLHAAIESKTCSSEGSSTGQLQNSWTEAQNFYACCQVKYGNSNWNNLCHDESVLLPVVNSPDIPLVNIQNCPGYFDETVRNPLAKSWSYLQYLETNYNCAGFCSRGSSFWTNQPYASQTCGSVVEILADTKIGSAGLMISIYSAIVGVLFVLWFSFVSKSLKELQGKGGLLSSEPGLSRYTYED